MHIIEHHHYVNLCTNHANITILPGYKLSIVVINIHNRVLNHMTRNNPKKNKLKKNDPLNAKACGPHRRNALKSVTLTTVGMTLLPQSWQKPIVKTILLPAHAQTSATTQAPVTTQSPSRTLSLPGFTQSCSSTPISANYDFAIDDTVLGSETLIATTEPGNSIRINTIVFSTFHTIGIRVFSTNRGFVTGTIDCPNAVRDAGGSFSEIIVGRPNNTPYLVTASVSTNAAAGMVSLSGIIFTPQ